MNFGLTQEQQMIKEMVRDFAKNEIAPYAKELDITGRFPIETFRFLTRLLLRRLAVHVEAPA